MRVQIASQAMAAGNYDDRAVIGEVAGTRPLLAEALRAFRSRRCGRGSVSVADLTIGQAAALLADMDALAFMDGPGTDPECRPMYRAMKRAADRLRAQIGAQ